MEGGKDQSGLDEFGLVESSGGPPAAPVTATFIHSTSGRQVVQPFLV